MPSDRTPSDRTPSDISPSDRTLGLVRLNDTGQTVADTSSDIRGRSVMIRGGEEIGKVDDLLIDPLENEVRFLVVASGGFLGLGKAKSFIPVEAVTNVTDDKVQIDQSREKVAGAPAYDPELVNDTVYHESVFNHYGYRPDWATGYAKPGNPNRTI